MTGEVKDINHRRNMVAVFTVNGDYSIFEQLSGEVAVGDQVEWRGETPLGRESLRNITQGIVCDVYFQNHQVSRTILRQQLRY